MIGILVGGGELDEELMNKNFLQICLTWSYTGSCVGLYVHLSRTNTVSCNGCDQIIVLLYCRYFICDVTYSITVGYV